MPWMMVAAAGIGYLSSRRSAREMRRMRREMRRQRQFAEKRWQHFRDTYGDLESILVTEAEQGVVADIEGVSARASQDVEHAFGRQRDEDRRRMASFGLDPSGGHAQSRDRQFGLQQALAESFSVGSARENERRWADAETNRRRTGMLGFGGGMGAQAAQDVQHWGGQIAQSHAQSAQMYSDLAGNLFTQAGTMAGYGLSPGGQQTGALSFSGNAPTATLPGSSIGLSNYTPGGGFGLDSMSPGYSWAN